MKNQNAITQNDGADSELQGGMTKFARGGISMTISTVPQEERERSGSQPRYPYEQAEPFQGQNPQNRKYSPPRNQYRAQSRGTSGSKSRRVPKEYQGVESTIKSIVD